MLFDFIRDVVAVLGALGVVGAASVGLAYWLFKTFAKGWLDARFAKELAAFNARKDQELERLRAEISRLADRASRFHEKEYEVLPEAWGLLNRAHGAVDSAVTGFQQLPDLDRMNDAQVEEFLASSDLRDTEKAEIKASRDRTRLYGKIDRWRTINEGNRAQAEFNNYVILNGVFIENSIADKMTEAAKLLRSAVVAARMIEQGNAGDLHQQMWAEFKKVEPLVAEIKDDVKRRLWTIQLADEVT